MTRQPDWPPKTNLTPQLVAELMPLDGDGLIARALSDYVRGAERAAWRGALLKHVVRYAGLPDIQTAALIDEIGSYLEKVPE